MAKMVKKTTAATYIIYVAVGIVILYIGAAVGLAFDKSYGDGDKIDYSQISVNLNNVINDYGLIVSNVIKTDTECFKMSMVSGFAYLLAIIYFLSSKRRTHRIGEEHGSARWAEKGEAKKLADKKDIGNNIILTQDVKMSLNTRQHRENLNVLVIGGSGSGKSMFYVKPNLMQLNTSYVVTDPKGELLRTQGKMLEHAGYEVRVFNLIDMKNSGHYNPFVYVFDKSGNVSKPYVIKMIDVLMRNTKKEKGGGGDQFWDDATRALLSALSFYLLEVDPDNANWAAVMKLLKLAKVKEDDEDFESDLDLMFKDLELNDESSMAVSYYKDFKMAAGDTAKSILISCSTRLQAFNLPEVADLMHKDTLALDSLGDKKTALFIIIPASDSTFNFLAAMMYTQLFDNLYDVANFKHNGRLPVHVRCLLDEFANIGQIPDFDKLLATMRSMEISANVIIQNIAQLKSMYKDTWEVITGNCDSFLFLGGKEESTLKMVSELLGKETIDRREMNRTKGRQGSSSEANSIIGRELLTPSELSVMPMNDCVLFVRAFNPFYGKKFDTFNHQNYKLTGDSDSNNNYNLEGIVTDKMPLIEFNTNLTMAKAETTANPAVETEIINSEKYISAQTDIPDIFDEDNIGEYEGTTEMGFDYEGGGELMTSPAEEMFLDSPSGMEEMPLDENIQAALQGGTFLSTAQSLVIEHDDELLDNDDDKEDGNFETGFI